jgi:hypothetical protein
MESLTPEISCKKEWETPELVEYGNLKEITHGCDKTFGASDGFTFQGQAITCSGS